MFVGHYSVAFACRTERKHAVRDRRVRDREDRAAGTTKRTMIIVIFGVSGAGKTTVGKMLTEQLGWRFLEADNFHPATNIEKMRNFHPLTDEDRWPWLERLRQQIERSLSAGENAVLACSALKRAYRDRLRVGDEVKFVFLRGDYALVEKQLDSRHGHFMNAALLQSQFDDLEEAQPDENVLTIQLGRTPQEIVEEIKTNLNLAGSG
jgi:gluconokinase